MQGAMKRLKRHSRPSMASSRQMSRFLCPGSSGIFTKSSVCRPGVGFAYSTVSTAFSAAPPPLNPRMSTMRRTSLSGGRVPARRKALVSQAGPNARSCSTLCGKWIPKCSPGSLVRIVQCNRTNARFFGWPSVERNASGIAVGVWVASERRAPATSHSSDGSGGASPRSTSPSPSSGSASPGRPASCSLILPQPPRPVAAVDDSASCNSLRHVLAPVPVPVLARYRCTVAMCRRRRSLSAETHAS
mmetsp:Transcript_110892/g.313685  ORF Transcript_110892/g.313685 Transcript_110892/m.313685 type:complete len:245 (+) Transcript_110892:928-1662(+)